MYVIGTAGHVDHGKSTLVRALTGIDPDRLEEEKRREMTIDLGFAWLKLPSLREISLVDVPGHERFIKNMLAGVGGFDAALLVVAADEGFMPQTQEHLDILNLLDIRRGVVALTKCDMVDDEWLELVTEETRERLKGSGLESAPLVPVSARTGAGLPELLKVLDATLGEIPARPDFAKPRLPIDRVFSISGFGTVVTGTLSDGTLKIGQEVTIEPGGLKSRVRGLQMHKAKVESVPPGNRVAVNLVGLEVGDLQRGQVLTLPGVLEATDRLDVRLNLLPTSPVTVTQNSRFDFFSGAAVVSVGVTVLDAAKIEPGQSGLLQLRLAEPLALAKGDRFILRLPSPSQTIGGGVVLDIRPRRHKRFQAEVIETLQTLEQGTPSEIVLQSLSTGEVMQPREVKALATSTGLTVEQVNVALEELAEQVLILGEGVNRLVLGRAGWDRLTEHSQTLLKQFHAAFPLKRGMSREELKSKLSIASPKTYNAVLNRLLSENVLTEQAISLNLPDWEVRFNPAQQKQADALLTAYRATPYAPPSITELGTDVNIVAALVERGDLKKVGEGVYFITAAYNDMQAQVLAKLDEQGQITLAEVRDMFNSSRKYIQVLLEYFDEIKLTRRKGDVRIKW